MEKQLHLLTGSYALNALSDAEREDFEQHALSDPETLEEVRGLSETAALLAYGTRAETPPQALKADVMAAIRNTRQLPASSVVRDIGSAKGSAMRGSVTDASSSANERRRWVQLLSAAAALLLVAGFGLGGWIVGQNASNTAAEKQLAANQAQQEALLAIVGSADAKIGTTVLPGGGTVTVASSSTTDSAAVMVNDMPAPPAGKTYELWFISPAGAVSAGLMEATQHTAMQILQGPMGGATHVGITVEPAGGSPKPTTTPIVVQAI